MLPLKWIWLLTATLLLNEDQVSSIRVGHKPESSGTISGVKEVSTKGRVFYSYRSIPYAKPPLGHLRFKDPEKADKWEGVKDGTRYPSPCLQPTNTSVTSSTDTVLGSEDCLYLNIHTPRPHSNGDKLAVMVFLHGGGYYSGASYQHQPHILLNHDVVLVVIQYRLGILGFLSTEDDVIPGNFGLKDQTMALRWVQKNIANFGGDPQRVTLFGEGAGAASVHLQMLTPKAEGLFSRAILQSGSALCPWALGGAHRQVTEHTARILSCPTDRGSQQLLSCLQKADSHKLTLSLSEYFVWMDRPRMVGPRVDGKYLPASPEVLMMEGRHREVDIISGINAHEGSLITAALLSNESLRYNMKNNFSLCGVASMEFREGDLSPINLAHTIFQQYVGDLILEKNYANDIAEAYGDRLYAVCHDLTSLLHARNLQPFRRTYLYQLTHRGQRSSLDAYPPLPWSNRWISHRDDLQYLFPSARPSDHQSHQHRQHHMAAPQDRIVSHMMSTLWTNFATTGRPTPDDSLGFRWETTNEHQMRHLALNPMPIMMDDTREGIRGFWNSLPTKQNLVLQPSRVKSEQFHHYQTTQATVNPKDNKKKTFGQPKNKEL